MNAMVKTGAEAIGNADVDWLVDTIRVALADASFTPTYDAKGNINNAQFFSTISASIVGTPQVLTGKTNVAGVLDADNPLFPAVTGNTVVRMWAYKWTGTAGTSQLILAYDTGQGFPVLPDGSDIEAFWDTGVLSGVAGLVQI